MQSDLLLYTDGSCCQGKGGWGWILKRQYGQILDTIEKENGCEENTTISRMEMTAILMGLLNIIEKRYIGKIYVVSDSQFIVNSFNKKWFNKWKQTGFIDRPNADLWKLFDNTLPLLKEIQFIHTRGHDKGMEFHKQGNREVDELCSYKNFFDKV